MNEVDPGRSIGELTVEEIMRYLHTRSVASVAAFMVQDEELGELNSAIFQDGNRIVRMGLATLLYDLTEEAMKEIPREKHSDADPEEEEEGG